MKKMLVVGSGLLVLVSAVMGQTHEGPPPPPGPGGHMRGPGPGGPPEMFAGIEGRTVTGAPFTAQVVSTSSQTLSDGSHISRNLNATVARDGSGRTYRSQTMDNLGPVTTGSGKTMVFIHDPVAHTSHVITPDTKSAVMTHMPERNHGLHGGPAAVPGAAQTQGRPVHQRPGETVETLAPQNIEGVWAEGTRITRTIPAGSIGNDHDLKIVSETWYSKDLQMVVMSRHSDPRMGESTYKLTNIQRAEPDATLFQVPAGFKVTERGHAR